MLGQVYLDVGNSAAAEVELGRAGRDGANAEAVALGLAEVQLLEGKFDEMLKGLPTGEPAKPDRQVLRGRAYLGLGQIAPAVAAFKAAAAAEPQAVAPEVWLGRAALAANDLGEAGQHLAKARERAPQDVGVLALQGDLSFAEGKYDASEVAFREMVKLRQGDRHAYVARLGIARAQLNLGKTKDAIAELDPLLKAAPNEPNVNYLRGVAAYQGRDYQAALNRADLVLKVASDYRPAILLAGAASYALGQNERALSHLERFVGEVPGNLDARKLLAAAQLRAGRAKDAAGTLQPAVASAGDDAQVLSLIGTAMARRGDLQAARGYFQRVVAQKPDDAVARARLGVTKVALGDSDEGLDEIEKAIEQDPKLQKLEIGVALSHLRARQFDKALESAKRIQAKLPDNPAGFTLEGLALSGKGDLDKAKAAFRKALELKPGAPDAAANLAALEVRQGNLDEADRLLKELLSKNPGNLDILLRLTELADRQHKPADGKIWLDQAIAAHPDAVLPRAYLARWYLAARQPDQALQALQPIEAQHGREPIVLEVMGQAQMTQGQFAAAVKTYQLLVAAVPKSPQARVLLAAAYAEAGDAPKMKEQVVEALKLKPDYLPATLALARYSILARDFDAARTQIRELVKQAPNDPRVKELEARLVLSEGDPKRAAELMREARKAFDNPGMAMTQALAEWQSGEREASVKTLEEWIARNPKDTGMRLELNRYYLGLGRRDAAKANLSKILEIQPDNYVALNNSAWLLYQDGDLETAQKRAEKAHELAPKMPQVKDTLGVILTARKETRQATALLREAAQEAPNDPLIAYHLAQVLSQSDERDEARDLLRKTLASHPQFSERDKAELLLKELGG